MKAIEKELRKIENAENRMRIRNEKNAKPAWTRKLEERVPEKVIDGLQKAFSKAFYLIFEKGVGVIEKTYDKQTLEKKFLIRDYAFELMGGSKEIRRLKTDVAGKRAAVTLGSAVEGIGLGVLGIGMPDIVIWLGILLRSIYETALEYGYNYESLEEKFIQGIPIVGMIGGGANPIYYQKVMRYVQLKYRKRYLLSKNH